jgi:perosamine synthetase
MTILQIEPSFGSEETAALLTYLSNGNPWLTEFKKTRELEQAVAHFVGAKHCFMVPNGTLALYAVWTCLGLKPGDEVIVPAFTMIATAEAVRMTGATPVLVDVDVDNFCLDLRLVERAITARTKAICVVDLNGRSPNMEAALVLAESHGLTLVEDAAQAFGSCWHDKHLGTFGKAGCYSFSPHKVISTGQGGAVVTDDDELANRIRRFKNFGRASSGGTDHDVFGTNLKFTDLQAVVGLEQMKKLLARIDKKRAMFALYRELLAEVKQVKVPEMDLNSASPWYIDILARDRDGLYLHLKANGIETRSFYPPIHHTGAYAHLKDKSFQTAETLAQYGLWLPSAVTLEESDIYRVCEEIKNYYNGG